MGGKAAILLVLGFSIIFAVVSFNFDSVTNKSVDNQVSYFSKTRAYNLAASGANIVLNEIFINPDWNAGYSKNYESGTINVTVNDTGSLKEIVSTGTFFGFTSKVKVDLKASSYAKYAWYAGNMNSKVFVTGDTVWGPLHTQSSLNIGGDPVFFGKVTALKGINPDIKQLEKNGYQPEFHGGFESGVDMPIPVNYQFTDQKNAALEGVNNKGGSSYFTNTDVWLTFNANGTITYRTGSGNDSSTYSAPVTENLNTFAPNDVIYIGYGNVYVSGTVNGRVSLVAGESSGSGHGNVYIVDDLTYTSPPMVWDNTEQVYKSDKNVDDMLGILASNNVRIANTKANVNDKNVYLDAAIFAAQGGFEMEDNTIPPSGKLHLNGSVVAAKEELIAIANSAGNIEHGYSRHVVFDERMLIDVPPYFPTTGKFEIVSWFE